MNRIRIFILAILLFFFYGCGEGEVIPKPKNLLPEETYINLIVELQLLDAMVYTSESELNTDSLISNIYNFYDTNKEIFSASHLYYQSKPDEHSVRVDSALKKIEREQKKLN